MCVKGTPHTDIIFRSLQNPALKRWFGVSPTDRTGLLVSSVGACSYGLKANDVLLEVDGNQVSDEVAVTPAHCLFLIHSVSHSVVSHSVSHSMSHSVVSHSVTHSFYRHHWRSV